MRGQLVPFRPAHLAHRFVGCADLFAVLSLRNHIRAKVIPESVGCDDVRDRLTH